MSSRRRPPNILECIDDAKLFAPWFRRGNWAAWSAFLAALFGLPMTDTQRTTYTACTGRFTPPTSPAREAWLVVGRRGGKSFILALCAVYLACFRDWSEYLSPGERGTIMILAQDRRASRAIFRFISALLRVPMLAKLIQHETAQGFDLANNITIEIHAASFRSVRGYAIIAALLDEVAIWPTDDAADPDYEVITALHPAMAQFPNSLLMCASSPYARRGSLWDAYKKHFGKEHDPVLVWQAPTRDMNPTISQAVIDSALEKDAARYSAEYMAEFRSDLEAFVNPEAVERAVINGTHELSPMAGATYVGFADAAGGSGTDSFAAAVAFRDHTTGRTILAGVRERKPPFSPEATITDLAQFFLSYGLQKIYADRWGGEFPVEQFRKHGVTCEISERVKSEIYGAFLPLLNSDQVQLLDHSKLLGQLCGLERRTARSGKESIDHPPGGHDDLINAAAGAIVIASGQMNKAGQWAAFARASIPPELTGYTGDSAILFAQEKQHWNDFG